MKYINYNDSPENKIIIEELVEKSKEVIYELETLCIKCFNRIKSNNYFQNLSFENFINNVFFLEN